MSRAPLEATNVPNAGFGTADYQYPPQSAQDQPPQGGSNFVDGSGPIFSMYLEMAAEEYKKMAENWKADADGILIFTGLFSAAVASLISVSVQDIRPDSQDTSNFYLANIYQAVADPSRLNISSSFPLSPPTFSPPTYAIWVNALWFMSLVISLTCALLATLLQQWARRYLKATQPRYSPHKRARIRAFFAEGVEKFFLPWTVELLPTLLHVSLLLFFAGLAVFLCNINLTIFRLVVTWVSVWTALYGCVTIMPIFRHDSPYHTPLLLAAWHIVTGMAFVAFRALRRFNERYFGGEAYHFFRHLEESCRKLVTQGMQKTAEETALKSPSVIDTHVFLWTFDSLDEDHELERFFSGLPGFRSSKVVDDPLIGLDWEEKGRLSAGLIGLFDRTFSSDLLPDPIKRRRAIICAKAIDPKHTPGAMIILDKILFDYRQSCLVNEIVRTVRGWGKKDGHTVSLAEASVSKFLAIMQQRDDSWFVFASSELRVAESVLRDYAAHGDSLSLAILIHITRQQFSNFLDPSWPRAPFSGVLQMASNFRARDTSPELQHKFCALWNEIVLRVQNEDDAWSAGLILGPIRNVYIALHQDTDYSPTRFSASTSDRDPILSEPSSYPLCSLHGHHPDSTPHIHDDSSSTTFAFVLTALHDIAALAPASLASPDVASILRLAFNLSAIERTIESRRISPDQGTTRAAATHGGIDTTARTMTLTYPEPSASNPPSTSIVPPDVVVLQRTEDSRTSSDALDVPLPPSPTLFDNTMHPTSPVTRSDHTSSAFDLGAAGEGSAKAAPYKDRDALGFPSAIRENIMASSDLPPQLPSLSLVTDVAIAGSSWLSLDTEHTGDHPPHPSYGQYDIV